MSCCPAFSWPYLEPSHTAMGTVQEIEGFQFYQVGNDKGYSKGIIICPDVWGWNGGTVRNTADLLSEQGYNVVILKILTPPMDPGKCTDGDGIPPEFKPFENFPALADYLKTLPYERINPNFSAVVKKMQDDGVSSVGVIGACWGGWVVNQILADDSLPELVKSATIWHPSVHVEELVFGRDTEALIKKAQRPILLMPAGDDPEGYQESGNFFTALKAAQPMSEIVFFPDMSHGWTTRGDMSEPVVKRDVEAAMTKTIDFFGKTV